MDNKPICLQDLSDEVEANRCLLTGKTENTLSDLVNEYMNLLTPEYIKKAIVEARTDDPTACSVTLIRKQHDPLVDRSRLFYECSGQHTESLESRIESLIDMTTMQVALNHDADEGWLLVTLYWGGYMFLPVSLLRRPFKSFVFGIAWIIFFIVGGLTTVIRIL